MNHTIKEIRVNALGLSKPDFAKKLGMSLTEYENLENSSTQHNNIKFEDLIKIAHSTGMPIEALINVSAPKMDFTIEDNWSAITSFKQSILKYLNDGIQNQQMNTPLFTTKLAEISQLIEKGARKPKVALVGRSDVGKSTLINSLTNTSILPQGWSPTTSIAILVKHIDDKPAYCTDNVLIFKADKDNSLWDDTRLTDQKYTRSLCIASGDYKLLHEYGARQGSKFNYANAASAVVFIDSPILKNCDFIDLPGYGTKDRDEDDTLLNHINDIDILIYLSLSNGFMRGEDINWLQTGMTNLSPLSLNNKDIAPLANLFIVASQADTVSNGAHSELNNILEAAANRFEKTLSSGYWKNFGEDTGIHDFRKRFFTYSTKQSSLKEDFENDLRHLLKTLTEMTFKSLKTLVFNSLKDLESNIKTNKKSFEKTLYDKKEAEKKYKKVYAELPSKLNEIENKKAEIIHCIENTYLSSSSIKFKSAYNSIMTKEYIVKLINENGWGNNEEDIKSLCTKISNLLKEEYTNSLKEPSEDLTIRINKILADFNSYITNSPINDLQVNGGFNVQVAFASGLTSLVTYGALAFWAAQLGNLGGYILVAKGVSLLAAMGISVGGTATAISAISLIGGPITLMIGTAILAALLVFMLFGGSWKDKFAKKIIDEYNKHKVLDEFDSNIVEYWANTRVAFTKAIESMQEQYIQQLSALEAQIKTDDDQIKKELEINSNQLNYLSKILKNFKKNSVSKFFFEISYT